MGMCLESGDRLHVPVGHGYGQLALRNSLYRYSSRSRSGWAARLGLHVTLSRDGDGKQEQGHSSTDKRWYTDKNAQVKEFPLPKLDPQTTHS